MSQKAISYAIIKPCHIHYYYYYAYLYNYTQLWHDLHTIISYLMLQYCIASYLATQWNKILMSQKAIS